MQFGGANETEKEHRGKQDTHGKPWNTFIAVFHCFSSVLFYFLILSSSYAGQSFAHQLPLVSRPGPGQELARTRMNRLTLGPQGRMIERLDLE